MKSRFLKEILMMNDKINNRKDILLLLLYSPGVTDQYNESIIGRTRVVKMLFLFKKEALKFFKKGTQITEDNFYKYFPWDYGPFSEQVYDDITFFLLHNYIESKNISEDVTFESIEEDKNWGYILGIHLSDENEEFVNEEFSLTEKGKKFVNKNLYPYLSEEQKNLLKLFKKKINSLSLRSILDYVYKVYPSMTENSKIKEKFNS